VGVDHLLLRDLKVSNKVFLQSSAWWNMDKDFQGIERLCPGIFLLILWQKTKQNEKMEDDD
jgi:hypothetical protein